MDDVIKFTAEYRGNTKSILVQKSFVNECTGVYALDTELEFYRILMEDLCTVWRNNNG